jgi:molybdopterin-guanine dinucleotide biosynthesis protein A
MSDEASQLWPELSGGILAGGRSNRFGSNKALFAPDGERLIERAVRLLRPFCAQVLVSASHANADAYRFLGLDIVEDLHADCGPLGGLEALLTLCATPWMFILACDMPYVSSDALLTMAGLPQLSEALGGTIQAFAWKNKIEGSVSPFPLLIRRSVLPSLQKQMSTGRLGVKTFLSTLNTYYIPTDSTLLLRNVNRPEDWEEERITI